MHEDVAIGVEYLGLGDKAQIVFLFVHDGQIPCAGVFEDLHDLLHRHIVGEDSLRRVHQLPHRETFVQTGLEHDVAHFVEQQDAEKTSVVVDDREDIAMALGNDLDEFGASSRDKAW